LTEIEFNIPARAKKVAVGEGMVFKVIKIAADTLQMFRINFIITKIVNQTKSGLKFRLLSTK
jgi:hypothetical protein